MSEEKRRGARRLSHAEHELWRAVTADVKPFHPPSPSPAVTAPLTSPPPSEPSQRAVTTDRPPPAKKAPAPAADIDHRTYTKIKRGRLEVDSKLDLHGLRQAEAQRVLFAFLRRAQAQGAKLVIVVTGKGSREDSGVLRRVVPMWLEAPNLRDVVIGFGEAARHHGGEGALYVRIRRASRADF